MISFNSTIKRCETVDRVRRGCRRCCRVLAYGTVLICCARFSHGADWPVERGDASASGASAEALPSKLDVEWTYNADEGGFEAAPVVVGGVVYIGDYDGTFHAVRLDSGKPVWTKKFDDTGFLGAATVAGGRVFVADFNGIVRCFTVEDGEVVWEKPTDSEVFAAPNYVAAADLVLVTTEGGQLLALDGESGDERWRFEIEAPLRCWPTVVEGRALLAGCDGRAHAIDVETGKEVDSVEIDGPTGSTPAVLGGKIYFGSEEGSFYCLSAKPLGIDWRVRDDRTNQGIRAAAALNEQAVLYSSQGRHLFAVHPQTGASLWAFPTRSRIDAPATIAGATAYVGTSRGRLFGVDIATGKETWQFEAGGKFLAGPAVSEKRLVIGNEDGTLYCFGEKQ